jgi:hypothetical protein
MAPVQLADLSISRTPGGKLSYFGYEFEVPWADLDEANSKMIGDDTSMIAFQSGNSLSVWHGSPRAFVNAVLSNDKIDQSTLRPASLLLEQANSLDFNSDPRLIHPAN